MKPEVVEGVELLPSCSGPLRDPDHGLVDGMRIVRIGLCDGIPFVPEVPMSSDAMQALMADAMQALMALVGSGGLDPAATP